MNLYSVQCACYYGLGLNFPYLVQIHTYNPSTQGTETERS